MAPGDLVAGLPSNELNVIQDGALLIRDGILVEVGPSRRVENLAQARGAIEINAAGTGSDARLRRCPYASGLPAGRHPCGGPRLGRARACIRPPVNGWKSARSAYLEAMARHGTTTVEVKTGCGIDESAEAKLLRMLGRASPRTA